MIEHDNYVRPTYRDRKLIRLDIGLNVTDDNHEVNELNSGVSRKHQVRHGKYFIIWYEEVK